MSLANVRRFVAAAALALVTLSAVGSQAATASRLRFGIYPGGGVRTVNIRSSVTSADDQTRRIEALQRLRGDRRVFVMHLYTAWDGVRPVDSIAADVAADIAPYTAAGFDVEPTVRYRPAHPSTSSPGQFATDVAGLVGKLATDRHVVSIQIGNEANVPGAPDAADGAYPGAAEAIAEGVKSADRAAAVAGRQDIRIGINWADGSPKAFNAAFWRTLGSRGGPAFRRALDWVGVDIYPGTWSAPAAASGSARVVRDAFRSSLRLCRAKTSRSPVVLVDQASQDAASLDARGQVDDFVEFVIRRKLPAALMRTVRVVVTGVPGEDAAKVALAANQQVVQALPAEGADEPLGMALAIGERTGVLITRIPIEANTSSNAAVNLQSRSRINTVNWLARSPQSMSRFRVFARGRDADGRIVEHDELEADLVGQRRDVLVTDWPTANGLPVTGPPGSSSSSRWNSTFASNVSRFVTISDGTVSVYAINGSFSLPSALIRCGRSSGCGSGEKCSASRLISCSISASLAVVR